MLENKIGITDQIEPARAEEKISKQKAKRLFESRKINELEAGTLSRFSTNQQLSIRRHLLFCWKSTGSQYS